MFDVTSQLQPNLCDRVSRRRAIEIGALGTVGLGLPKLLRSAAADAAVEDGAHGGTFGKAKRVILLFMWGGPAHQDTWDLKPDGPKELRGEFLPIGTNVPGIHVSEHFPKIARHADKLAVIRSVGQEDNNHSTGAHAGLTGRRHEVKAENFAARGTDFPHFGSVLSNLRPNVGGMPTFVALPDVIATTAGAVTPGQGGGILGRRYDPFQITDHPDEPNFSISSLTPPGGLTDARMHARRGLMNKIDDVARMAERSAPASAMDAFYHQALDMVLSADARRAFDLGRVSESERWRYGWHTFGQSVLMARRLIESGVKLVTVYWHREKKTVDSSWDTHGLNFQELKNRLMPSVDRPIAALLEDLDEKGLLDETLVVWNSEFGRTPRINANAGRDHWGPCNSVVMAGGGVPGGQVFGASDKSAAYPVRDKVTQDDVAATIYHLLGLAPHTAVYDRTGRPHAVALGEPIRKLLGDDCRPASVAALAAPPRRPRLGPFTKMLVERGGRFLCCNLGFADSELKWELAGWGAPAGAGKSRHRRTPADAGTTARLKFTGVFRGQMDYSHFALRLLEPRAIGEASVAINGRALTIPADLKTKPAGALWQIPIPPGVLSSADAFELTLNVSDWPVCDAALVGDPIRPLHYERLFKEQGRAPSESRHRTT